MQPNTHLRIDPRFSGRLLELGAGRARVELETRTEMLADDHGLVHGGFVFSLADHAAMLAINQPNVVLGEVSMRFLQPVQLGETVVAEAILAAEEGKKLLVDVTVRNGHQAVVAQGRLICFVPDQHVLTPKMSQPEGSP